MNCKMQAVFCAYSFFLFFCKLNSSELVFVGVM